MQNTTKNNEQNDAQNEAHMLNIIRNTFGDGADATDATNGKNTIRKIDKNIKNIGDTRAKEIWEIGDLHTEMMSNLTTLVAKKYDIEYDKPTDAAETPKSSPNQSVTRHDTPVPTYILKTLDVIRIFANSGLAIGGLTNSLVQEMSTVGGVDLQMKNKIMDQITEEETRLKKEQMYMIINSNDAINNGMYIFGADDKDKDKDKNAADIFILFVGTDREIAEQIMNEVKGTPAGRDLERKKKEITEEFMPSFLTINANDNLNEEEKNIETNKAINRIIKKLNLEDLENSVYKDMKKKYENKARNDARKKGTKYQKPKIITNISKKDLGKFIKNDLELTLYHAVNATGIVKNNKKVESNNKKDVEKIAKVVELNKGMLMYIEKKQVEFPIINKKNSGFSTLNNLALCRRIDKDKQQQ